MGDNFLPYAPIREMRPPTMKIHRLKCFGRTEDTGNVALVIENGPLSEADRRAFAQAQQVPAAVFVDTNAAEIPQLDYYYPHTRSPLCLHATLAASAVFFARQTDQHQLRFVTRMRQQVIEVERDVGPFLSPGRSQDKKAPPRGAASGDSRVALGHFFITVTAQACPSVTIDIQHTAYLLKAEPSDVVSVRGPTSVGSPKLLVEMADERRLRALRPRLAEIADWSRAHGVSGIYAYCRLADGLYAGRNFNHLDPALEDAATGVAAGALALMREESITLQQGDALDQPCTLLTRYLGQTIQIGGRAAFVVD